MTTIPASTIDTDALRRAYASRSVEDLLALYAEDATVEIVDAVHMPSHPHRLTGREALRTHFEGVFARDMTHEADIVVATPSALGFLAPLHLRRRHEGRLRGHRGRARRAHRPRGRSPGLGLVR